MKPRSAIRRPGAILIAVIAVGIVATVVALMTPPERSYAFVTESHPIDRWNDGSDRWAYFSIGRGTTKDLAAVARTELAARGFTEDTSMKPWFRFVRGAEEVVVCNHNEFFVNGRPGSGKLGIQKTPMRGGQWPCVLVKNGPGTAGDPYFFQLKKLVYRW